MNCGTNCGKMRFTYGTMGSGKSTAIFQINNDYTSRGFGVFIIKPNCDTRNPGFITSRAIEGKIPCTVFDEKKDLLKLFEEKNVEASNDFSDIKLVIVDEAQFLKKEQVDQLLQITIKYGIDVFCYGLMTDYLTNLFEGSKRLVEIAECIEIKLICRCGSTCKVNILYKNGKIVTEKLGNTTIQIGDTNASDKTHYEAMCLKCYYEELEKAKRET